MRSEYEMRDVMFTRFFSSSLTFEKEDAYLSRCLGPDHLSDGCKVFTVATDSWQGDRRMSG